MMIYKIIHDIHAKYYVNYIFAAIINFERKMVNME